MGEAGVGAVETAAAADALLALPFDQYQRYRLIADVIERLVPQEAGAILDVGGWPGTLQRFLPQRRIVVADLQGRMPGMVRASGAALPFGRGQFAAVVSSDTFEHIPPGQREQFLGELARVARDTIVLGAPFDSPQVRAAEGVLREVIRAKYPTSYGFIEEHDEYGLPDLGTTRGALAGADFTEVALPNGYLRHWLPMLALYFALQWRSPVESIFRRLNAYYNLTYYPDDNREPSYRYTIVATRSTPERLAGLRESLTRQATAAPPEHDWPEIAALIGAIEAESHAAPEALMRRIGELEQLVAERTEWAEGAVRAVEERDATIVRLVAEIEELRRLAGLSWVYRMARMARSAFNRAGAR
jgi:hypothetical protein